MPVAVHADFQLDLRDHFAAELLRLGIPAPASTGVEDVCTAFYNVRRKLIAPHPRTVRRSRELQGRQLDPGKQDALNLVELEALHGADLGPRLSKKLLNPAYNDGLLNDWGIHHLHLGMEVESDGFVTRTAEILYVFVLPEALLFIDVLAHGAESFATEELIQIIHDNWPDALAADRAHNAEPGSLSPASRTPTQRTAMRRKFTMTTQVADGTIYVPPGGGIVTTGLSLSVRRAVDHQLDLARLVEVWARNHADAIRDKIYRDQGQFLDELRLRYVAEEPPRVLELQAWADLVVPMG